eukprot:3940421-Rhodomonas_salina.1
MSVPCNSGPYAISVPGIAVRCVSTRGSDSMAYEFQGSRRKIADRMLHQYGDHVGRWQTVWHVCTGNRVGG